MYFTRAILSFTLWTVITARSSQMDGNISLESSQLLEQGHSLFRSILPSDPAVLVLVCFFVIITIFSLFGNGCTLFSPGRSEDLSWEPRFTLWKNLIFSNVLLSGTQGPTVIYCLLQKTTLSYGVWCLTQFFIQTVCVYCIVFTISLMTLERYLYEQARNYISILTNKHLYLILSLTWAISVCFSAVITGMYIFGHQPSLLGKPTTGLLCEPDTIETHLGFPRTPAVFRNVVGVIVTLFCVFLYVFSYLRIYQEAHNLVQPYQQVNRKVRKTVFFYFFMLLLQLLSIFLKIVSDVLWELKDPIVMTHPLNSPPGWTSAGILHIMFMVMLQVPPCINPLIYGLRNREVREVLPRLLWWKTTS